MVVDPCVEVLFEHQPLVKMLRGFVLLLGSLQAILAAQTLGNVSILSYNVAGLPGMSFNPLFLSNQLH